MIVRSAWSYVGREGSNDPRALPGRAVSWLSLLLVILIGIDVILRYLFNWNSSANQELEWHLFAALFMLGAGYTLRHDKHVRVDVFYSQFSEDHNELCL